MPAKSKAPTRSQMHKQKIQKDKPVSKAKGKGSVGASKKAIPPNHKGAAASTKPLPKLAPAKQKSKVPKPAKPVVGEKMPTAHPAPLAAKKTMTNPKAGFVAILGAPNAGKSTLLNRLVGQKISIVSPKAQTTRMRITGVLTEENVQIGIVDTPGIFVATRRLDEAMVRAAWKAIEDADAVVLLVDATAKLAEKTGAILEEMARRNQRIIVALNKIDDIALEKLLPLAEKLNDSGIVDEIFMISALNGDGVKDLKTRLQEKMPAGPWFYDEDQLSDLPTRLLAAEITREQLYKQLQQELPYGATVVPESWEEKSDGSSVVRQVILVARANHRPIILGAGGSRIKSISQAARKEIEKFAGHKIHLFLEVKADERWQERPELYELFGLEFKSR